MGLPEFDKQRLTALTQDALERADQLCGWVGTNTFGRMGAPMEDEKKSRQFMKEAGDILTATTGKDVADRAKIAAYDQIMDGNREQRRQTIGHIKNHGLPKVQAEKGELWVRVLQLLLLPILFLINKGPFDRENKEN